MNNQMPRTPFSTPLSGSAKETELRLKNIFSGPKKRPPVLFLALMFSVCIFCGNLVSCQVADAEGDGLRPGDTSLQESLDPFAALNEKEEALLQALFQAANEQEEFQVPEARLLNTLYGDGCVLGVAFVTDHLENTLILGVMDTETKELTGPIFRCGQHTGVLKTATFSNYDGEYCLLYTFTGQMMGQYRGEAGVIRLDGDSIVWEWPVEGDIRDGAGTAYQEYEDYWNGRLALMAPGGVDIYEVNPDFEWGKEEPVSMWQISGDELFYSDPSSAAELPMPVYFQALNWLVGYTNDPGGWRITSLKPTTEQADPEREVDCFTLTACMDDGTGEFTADLFFSYEQEGGRRNYGGLDHAEVRDREISAVVPDPETRKAYAEILENLLYRSILPDRTDSVPVFDDMADNTFAVADVDGDGREELILLTRPNIYAGYAGYILDHHDGALTIQHTGFPSFTFYTNGTFEEDDSHAQGSWTSQFWPHNLYRYLPASDSYERVGHVDAWEKSVSDANSGSLPPFPTEKDTSGVGILYYITPSKDLGANFTGYSEEPVDQSVYLEWLKPYIGNAKPLALEYLSLTEENIARLK